MNLELNVADIIAAHSRIYCIYAIKSRQFGARAGLIGGKHICAVRINGCQPAKVSLGQFLACIKKEAHLPELLF